MRVLSVAAGLSSALFLGFGLYMTCYFAAVGADGKVSSGHCGGYENAIPLLLAIFFLGYLLNPLRGWHRYSRYTLFLGSLWESLLCGFSFSMLGKVRFRENILADILT